MKPKPLDTVQLRQTLPAYHLSADQIGTIVETFSVPVEAYEVEFCDSAGTTIAIATLRPSQFDVVLPKRD